MLPTQIDAVFTTGGTSLIPVVRKHLEATFGASKLRKQEALTSVVSGLAVAAAKKQAGLA